MRPALSHFNRTYCGELLANYVPTDQIVVGSTNTQQSPMPEMWNNAANKFFDALAAGKPVMINYSGWQADLLHESGAGIVVPPGDPAKAAAMLIEFLSNSESVRKAGLAAQRLAAEKFDSARLAERWIQVLEEAGRGL